MQRHTSWSVQGHSGLGNSKKCRINALVQKRHGATRHPFSTHAVENPPPVGVLFHVSSDQASRWFAVPSNDHSSRHPSGATAGGGDATHARQYWMGGELLQTDALVSVLYYFAELGKNLGDRSIFPKNIVYHSPPAALHLLDRGSTQIADAVENRSVPDSAAFIGRGRDSAGAA
jgi:hypothetical protein